MTSRRSFLRTFALGLAGSYAHTAFASGPKPPNLLVVFPDQMRAHALGFMGLDRAQTPRLDAFARQAHTFTQAISNYPVCSPFRAILLSGAMPEVSGVWANCASTNKRRGPELRADITCWSDLLARTGYTLGYIGKWHLDAPHPPWIPTYNNSGAIKWNEWCPPERRHGFSHWHAYGTYDWHLRPMYWDGDAPREGFHFVDQWGPEHEADRAIDFLKTAQRPFALVVSMNPPHTGYELVPEKYRARFRGQAAETLASGDYPPADTPMGRHFRKSMPDYLAAVNGVDEQFGRILDALAAEHLEEDTIVLFCSDHGCCLGAHNLPAKNNPYEESLRIPLMIRWTGHIPPTFDAGLVDAFDLAPTLLGLLGQTIPSHMVGRNLAPHLLSTAPAELQRPCLYLHQAAIEPNDRIPATPIGTPEHTLPNPHSYGCRGLRDARYTVVFSCPAPGKPLSATLWDRQEDPDERTNLADSRPDLVATYRTQLRERLEALGDPFANLL